MTKKKAEARQLKIKSEKEDNKQSIIQRKRKSRAKLGVPESLTKYAKLVQKVLKVAHADPVKLAILSKSHQSQQVQVPKKKPLSLLERQSLKRKNRKEEHASLVEKFKQEYGGLHKASKCLGVSWTTFHKLCKNPG